MPLKVYIILLVMFVTVISAAFQCLSFIAFSFVIVVRVVVQTITFDLKSDSNFVTYHIHLHQWFHNHHHHCHHHLLWIRVCHWTSGLLGYNNNKYNVTALWIYDLPHVSHHILIRAYKQTTGHGHSIYNGNSTRAQGLVRAYWF